MENGDAAVSTNTSDQPTETTATSPQLTEPFATTAPPTEPSQESKPLTLQDLVNAANRGDAASLKSLRQALDEHPEIWRKAGNLASHVEQTWIRLAAGRNALALESIQRESDRMRKELLGTSPTPIEKLLVDQVIACWLQLKHAEISAGSGRQSSLMQGRFHDQRLQKAQRRYMGALKMLAEIRRLPLSALMPATRESSPLPTVGEAFEKPPATPVAPRAEPASAPDTTAFRIFPEREAV
jgi:hypothetical protein